MNNSIMEDVVEIINSKMSGVIAVADQITKNNGLVLNGVIMHPEGSNIAPTVYVDDMLKHGLDAREIADNVIRIYQAHEHDDIMQITDHIHDFSAIKDKLTLRLINRESNRRLLERIPYLDFMDLAVIVVICFDLPTTEAMFTVQVSDGLLSSWGVTFDDVYSIAESNLMNTETIITGLTDELQKFDSSIESSFIPFYIMANKQKHNGAVHMLKEDIIKKFAEGAHCNVVVIPSSIHEVILCPYTDMIDIDEINEMIREVNDAVVSEDEVLSNHAYIYTVGSGWSSIISE